MRSMLDASGIFRGIVGVARDNTERRLAEAERNRSQIFLSKLLDTIPDPVFVKDTQRQFVLVNEALCVFLGHSRQELLGKKDTDFLSLEQAEAIRVRDTHVRGKGM